MGSSDGMPRGKPAPRYIKLRDRLRKARKLRQLNYSELARLANVSHTTVQNIEAGRTTAGASVETIEKLADALSVDPAWLAYGATGTIEDPTKESAE